MRADVRTELISIPTPTAPLDGVLYTPATQPVRGGVLLMHGNTMNFYTGASRFLPPRLTAMGFACLAYNRRGHDVLTTRASRVLEGGAFQTGAEALEDNELAARFFAERGFDAPIVIGHSNGGMLAAQFGAGHPGTRALVLLSAHRGGPRSDRPRIPNVMDAGGTPFLTGDRSEELLAHAEQLVAEGRGRELLLVPGWWHAISAESLVDRAYRTPDTVEAAARVECPVLFIRGDAEPAAVYPAELFRDRCAGPCEVVIVDGCDHFYTGREAAVADVVADWLERALDPDGSAGAQDPAGAAER